MEYLNETGITYQTCLFYFYLGFKCSWSYFLTSKLSGLSNLSPQHSRISNGKLSSRCIGNDVIERQEPSVCSMVAEWAIDKTISVSLGY